MGISKFTEYTRWAFLNLLSIQGEISKLAVYTRWAFLNLMSIQGGHFLIC